MKIISKNFNAKGNLLVILRTKNGKLIGEFYERGYKRGEWDMRATFEGKDATEYRVKEYFGFNELNF